MAKSGWSVGCFGFNGPLRQYFSLYRAWPRVYAMDRNFSVAIQTLILSAGTSEFLKQIISLKSFNSVMSLKVQLT